MQEVTFYPWGRIWNQTSGYFVHQLFASLQDYDPDMDQYQTPNRMYPPILGRWLTPDALGGDVTNPQSLNRYAYALNSPATMTDPSGLYSTNPGDPCSGFAYALSHAQCDGIPPMSDSVCGAADPDYGPCDPGGSPWPGIWGSVGVPPPPIDLGGGSTGGGSPGGRGGTGNTASGSTGSPNANLWVSPTLTAPASLCSKYGGSILGGMGDTNMPCFYILVTSSATFGGHVPPAPGPGPKVENAGIVPTHRYKDFLACGVSAVLFLPGSERGQILAFTNLALWSRRAVSDVYPATALAVDLLTALQIRETCVHEVYGPGHY